MSTDPYAEEREQVRLAWNRMCAGLALTGRDPEDVVDRVLARATTPGDDRGRELAEGLLCVCDPNPETTDGPRPECPRHGINGETLRWLHAVGVASVGTLDGLGEHLANRDALRALAAPAETEAGDVPELWWSASWMAKTGRARSGGLIVRAPSGQLHGQGPGGAWTCVGLQDGLPADAVRLAATPPAPEGEADWSGVVPAERDRAAEVATAAVVAGTGTSVGAAATADAVLDDLRSAGFRLVEGWLPGERDEPAPAGPQAEGAGGSDEQCQAWAGSEHVYLSTGCLHGEHGYCQAMTGQQGEKRPGRCKFCDARCVCPCHVAGQAVPATPADPTGRPEGETADGPLSLDVKEPYLAECSCGAPDCTGTVQVRTHASSPAPDAAEGTTTDGGEE